MGIMTPSQPAVGDLATAGWADEVAQDIIDLATTEQVLLFTPGVTTDVAAGTTTWLTLGNITVPTWATKCTVNYTLNGIYDTSTTGTVTAVIKIGSATGAVSKRITGSGIANQRFQVPVSDKVTGLSTGSQSVTINTTQTAGTYRADTTSFVTAAFRFQP